MASNASFNNHNNAQYPQTSFTTPIAVSTNNTININSDHERKENGFTTPILNKKNQQQFYLNYNAPNNFANDNEKIKLNRKRHLSSSSNTSLSSHTLINNNYDDNHSNNPNVAHGRIQKDSNKPTVMITETTAYTSTAETTLAATQNHSMNDQTKNSNDQMNTNNSIPMSLFHTTNNLSEKIYNQNKNKKQKIEFNSQVQQKQCLTPTVENPIQPHHIDQERVDSLTNNNKENNMSKKEFDIPNSINYLYTREVQPSQIQNSNKLYNEIDNINQLTDENIINKSQCYYHNNTSINNLNNKINFENDSNVDKFLKFNNKNINEIKPYNTNINDSTSIATLKTIKNQNELNNIKNINNTISINNNNNNSMNNNITPSSPTTVFHQTIEYPTTINVNVNTSTTISIPQVTTTTTIKPVIQNSTKLFNPVSKEGSPITTTTTLIPYSFQTSNKPITAFSTVTTTHSPKITSQNSDSNGNINSPSTAMDGLHVSSPYYQNIYKNKPYISDYNNNNNNNNNNNYALSQPQQSNNYQMGKSSYPISNSPKSPIRQRSGNISGGGNLNSQNNNVIYHSPLRNSINHDSKHDSDNNNNVSYPYYNNGSCYKEQINDDNQNDGNNQNDTNQQQPPLNYNNHYYNSTGVKNKMNNSLLKNITTNNYFKRNINSSCNSPCKENLSNLNMYIVDKEHSHNHSQLPSPPLTGYEDSNVHFDFINNTNTNGSLYINDYKMYSNKTYPYNYSPISPDKSYPLLKQNEQNIYSFNPQISKYENDETKIMENNIIVNNMRVISSKNPVNIDMMNIINNNNSNKDEIMMNNKVNIKDEVNINGDNQQPMNYYNETKNEYDNQINNSNGQINNSFLKPLNKSSSNDNSLPIKKKFKLDNDINLPNNNNFKVIYSKKYSIGKNSKFKNNAPICQPTNIYPNVKEEMMINNNKKDIHNFHNQPSYGIPYTTMTTTVITSPTTNNPLKPLDNNSAILTPVPIPTAIPNRKVNNVILNSNLMPMPEEVVSDNNGQPNQGSQQQSKPQRKIMSSQLYQNSTVYDVNSLNINTINRMYVPNKTKSIPSNNGKSIIIPPPMYMPMNIPLNNNLPITLSTPSPSSPTIIPMNQQCSMVQQKSLQNNNYSLPIHYSSPCYPQNSPSSVKNPIPLNTNSPITKKQSSNSHSHGNHLQIQNPTANYQIPNVNSEVDKNQNQIQLQNQNNNMAIKRKHITTKRISSGQEIISDDGSVTWKIIKQLGKGGCGEVYLAQFVSGKKQPYKYCAIKFIKNKKVFYAETNTMKFLMDNTTCDYSPKIYSSCPKQRFLLMEYIQGENLTQKFESCGHYFSLKTILMVLMELMRLTKEFYTSTGLVHVDIKPSNFMVDLKNKIYLIDFGYATAPNVKLPGQTGTPLFMSQAIQSQGTICPSFQDDIESIGYVMMYFLKGGKLGLPWGLFKTHSEIVAAKTDANIYNFFLELRGTEYEPICNLLYNFLTVSRKRDITFDEKEYNKLNDSIIKVFNDCGFVNDQCYDWNNIPKKV